eukprot:UN02080
MATISKRAVADAQPLKTSSTTETKDEYTPCIVTLETDEFRARSLERRKYEEEHPETVDWEKRMPYHSHAEFGGWAGVTTIMVFSHILIWFFTVCLKINDGLIIKPESFTEFITGAYAARITGLVIEHCTPEWYHVAGYIGFLIIQSIFVLTLPAFVCYGEPLPELKGKKLLYYNNGLAAFWVTFGTFVVLHVTGIFRYSLIVDNIAPLATCAMLTADFISFAIYYNWFGTGAAEKNISGNFLYDLFMGVVINPRIGMIDIKMLFEARISWIVMSMITASAAVKFYETYGYLSNNMIIITTGITIYSYSVMKGEHLIIPTFDITSERYGLMLCFWNSALPFLYSAQSIFILRRDPADIAIPDVVFYLMMTILLVAYYCFDTVMAQKSSFRQMYNGTFKLREWAWPQFSYGTIQNPTYLRTKAGSPLLLSGWFRYARKWNYTTDITMGLMWSLSCGFNLYFIPKFYITFFFSMLMHRLFRDEAKCQRKYGKDWETYCSIVKYRLLPGIW